MLSRRVSKTCIAASVVLLIAGTNSWSETPATKPAGIDLSTLVKGDGGPPWELQKIEASIPPATADVEFARNKPVPPKTEANVIVKAVFKLLHVGDKPSLEQANKLIKYAANKLADPNSVRLNALMQFNGIGEVKDKSGALRSIVKMMNLNDIDASKYLAKNQLKMFVDECAANKSARKVASLPIGSAVKLTGKITEMKDNTHFVLAIDGTIPALLDSGVDNMKTDRAIDVAGYINKEAKLVVLAAEVPKPVFKCAANMEQPTVIIADSYQVHNINVAVLNSGKQTVRNLNIRVRCYDSVHNFDGYTRDFTISSLAPGAKDVRSLDFSVYHYNYDGTTTPKAEVTVGDFDW